LADGIGIAMAYRFDCKYFTGYKPCAWKRPCDGCSHYEPVTKRIAVLSLEALGAVLRSTCLLPAIKRQWPGCHVTWITYPNAKALLDNNHLIDRLLVVDATTQPVLEHLKFDVLLAVDKSIEAGALAERVQATDKRGFGLDTNGVIRPLNPEANYQYDVGLSDELKFFINQKAETQQITESMALPWQRDPYVLDLREPEVAEVAARRAGMLNRKGNSASSAGNDVEPWRAIIGYNTGCSLLYPYKKFTVERSIEVIRMWRQAFPDCAVALLGGREDTERQAAMKAAFTNDDGVINTPTTGGLRSGMLWMDATDLVLSGCSLGMHIAIALKKPVIAWFGVSCSQEVDLYDRGAKIQAAVGCSPCWKKSCTNEPKCFNEVSVEAIRSATADILTSDVFGGKK
jgi:ADP-heptose:LPS heptosyltransferase